MERMRKTEKSLGRFIARRSACMAFLLVAFIVGGNLAVVKATDSALTPREDLLGAIQAQKEEIKGLIAGNEAKIRELKAGRLLDLRRADFYSRPVYPSTQIFFNYWIGRSGRMKDRTEAEFQGDIEYIVDSMGGKVLADAEAKKRLQGTAMERLTAGNGTVDDDRRFEETIDVGANVKPAAPFIPQVSVSIPLSVQAPSVSLGTLPNPAVTAIAAPVITPPGGISTITPPNAPLVNVTTPGAISDVNVSVAQVEAPTAPSVAAKTVTIPVAPTVTPPVIEEINPKALQLGSGSYSGATYHWSSINSATATSNIAALVSPADVTTNTNGYIGVWGISASSAANNTIVMNKIINVKVNNARAIIIDETIGGTNYSIRGTISLYNEKNTAIDLQGTHTPYAGYSTSINAGFNTWDLLAITEIAIDGSIYGYNNQQSAMGFNNYDSSSNNTLTKFVNNGLIEMTGNQSMGLQLKPEIAVAGNSRGNVLMRATNNGTINIGTTSTSSNNSYALSTVAYADNNTNPIGRHSNPDNASGLSNNGIINIYGNESIGIAQFFPIQSVRNESGATINIKAGTKAIGVYTEVATAYLNAGDTDTGGKKPSDYGASGSGTPTVEVDGTINVAIATSDTATNSAGVRTGKTDGKITIVNDGSGGGGTIYVGGSDNYGAVQASTAGLINIESDASISVSGTEDIGYVLMDGTGKNEGTITATSLAATSGNIGFFGQKGTFTNDATGTIEATGKDSIAVILKKDTAAPVFNNNGAISIGPGADSSQPIIGVYNDGGTFTMSSIGTITLDNNTQKAVGLYNVAGTATIAGKITVGDTTDTTSSIGVIASSSAPVNFDSGASLDLGEYAIGLYSTDNNPASFKSTSTTDPVLAVDLATGAVFMYYDGGTPTVNTITSAVSFTTLSDNASLIYADKTATVTVDNLQSIATTYGTNDGFIPYVANGKAKIILNKDLTTNGKVGMAAMADTAPLILDGGDITVNGVTLKMTGDNSRTATSDVGIYSNAGTIVNNGTIFLDSKNKGMTGIFAEDSASLTTGSVTNSGIITLDGNATRNIGIFTQDNTKVTQTGTINIITDKSIGIYAKDSDVVLNLTGATNIKFEDGLSNYTTGSIGIYNNGKKKIDIGANVTFTSPNENKNILIYSEKEGTIDNTGGSTITVDGVSPATTYGNATIGVYLEGTATAPNIFSGTGGTLSVLNKAVGIYSNVYNKMTLGTVTATGSGTVGVFVSGDGLISGTVKPSSSAVGIFGKTGKLTIDTAKLFITLDSSGVGMYMQANAWATGADIEIDNAASASNVGIYYDPTNTTTIHDTNVLLTGSNPVMGIYVADGKTLTIAKTITIDAADSVGGMAGSGSTLILGSNGEINLNAAKNVGLYTVGGTITNNGEITVDTTITDATGMAGISTNTPSATTATVKNAGTINADKSTGMYLGGTGTTTGANTGNITVSTGTAVYINGGSSKFNGAGGTLTTTGIHGIALYLDSTAASAVTTPGALNLATDGIAVYAANNSPVDFAVSLSGTDIIGVVASTGATIAQNVSVGNGSVGIYVVDSTVGIGSAVSVTTGSSTTRNPVGIFLAENIGAYTINGTTVNAKNGIGIFVEGDPAILPTPTNLTLQNANVTTENGVAVFVDDNATLTTDGVSLNIKGGEGIYIAAGATANVGQNATDTVTFTPGFGGIGIYNDGGTLNLGANFAQVGNGTMAATKNGNFSYAGTVSLNGVTALLGIYDSAMTGPNTITNSGNLTITGGGIGVAAIEGGSAPSNTVTLTNSGVITSTGKNAAGQPSIALYTDAADIVNSGVIHVGQDGFGIYDESGKTLSNNLIRITGADATGIFIRDHLAAISASNITGTAAKSTGIALQNITADGIFNAGAVTLGDESVGILADDVPGSVNGVTVQGSVVLGDGSATKRAIGVIAKGSALSSKLMVDPSASFTIGNTGIGVYADSLSSVSFDADSFVLGTDGIYAYTTGGSLALTGGTVRAAGSIGLIFMGGGNFSNSGGSVLVTNGGTGVYVQGADVNTIPDGLVTVQGGTSTAAPYTMGVYYDTVAGSVSIPQINVSAYKAVGAILKNTAGTATNSITVPVGATDSIGVVAEGASNITANGGINVSGDRNAGIYANGGAVVVNGTIALGPSTADPNRAESSIGVYQKGNAYTGTGALQIGDNSIGYYGVGLTGASTQTGNLTLGESAIGISAEGTAAGDSFVLTGNIVAGDKAIGISGKNIDLTVNGNMNLGADGSLGIVSTGSGHVNYTGTITSGSGGSLGIYKKTGNGESATVNAGGATWTVGDAGYGIYALAQGTGTIVVTNNAPMDLKKSSLGIYADGDVQVTNNATIKAGDTDFGGDTTSGHTETQKHLNSVDIYAAGGATVVNRGLLEAKKDHSLAVYAQGKGTRFTNDGVIEVDNGGIGMLIREEAVGINNGTVNLGANQPTDTYNIGMAAYKDAKIVNNGVINVGAGIGMLIGNNGILENNGDIYVTNGVGIQGSGVFLNKGNIHLLSVYATPENIIGTGIADVGAVQITSAGVITINGQYVSVGGTLYTDGVLMVDGAYADVTSGIPVFDAQSVQGKVNILPDYALTGNGQTYEIQNFINVALTTTSGSKITPILGPLFVGKVTTGGDLLIAKRPYTDVTLGERFDTLYGQWDDILASDPYSPDSLALKSLNYYLAGLYDTQTYTAESARMLSETRGDIYATIQKRMENMQDAFDASFEELIGSRNFTRDTDKYSVMYRQGDYRDKTLGIDDYDYDIAGLYYMKDYDGMKFGDKYGWSAGFAVGNFRFDDAPVLHANSKERMYSVRAGLHLVKGFRENDKWQWTSRLEGGYNRHEATRRLELETLRTNRASYNTWNISLNNKLQRTILRTLTAQIGFYGALNLEYGNVSQFKERLGKEGALRLEIKGNDYFSIRPEIGALIQKKFYLGRKLSAKLEGKLAWAYELGDHYEGNRVRSIGSEGDWMRLVEPEKDKHAVIGTAVLTLEKADHYGISIEVQGRKMSCKEKVDAAWGFRLHYKFLNGR
ncbi:MAG: hypothetical protein LBQ96_02125 [Fusobacteriaceae bacterium]|nr:hypothetical protein [Fusobacteriaceae bacterium]